MRTRGWRGRTCRHRRVDGWGCPSRSRTRPALVDGTATVRGCTYSSCTSCQACSRPQKAQRVGAHGRGRSDRDDPPPGSRDRDGLRDDVRRPQQRHPELDQAIAHRADRVEPGSVVRRPRLRMPISPETSDPATTRSWGEPHIDVIGARTGRARLSSRSSETTRAATTPRPLHPARTRPPAIRHDGRAAASSHPAGVTVGRSRSAPPRPPSARGAAPTGSRPPRRHHGCRERDHGARSSPSGARSRAPSTSRCSSGGSRHPSSYDLALGRRRNIEAAPGR